MSRKADVILFADPVRKPCIKIIKMIPAVCKVLRRTLQKGSHHWLYDNVGVSHPGRKYKAALVIIDRSVYCKTG